MSCESDSCDPPPPRRQTASRQTRDSTTATAVATVYEHRRIVLAQGIERNNKDLPEDWKVPDASIALGAPVSVISDTEFECISHKQRVHYHAKIVNTKAAFIEALETPEIMTMYGGHARYGRGPCFGTDPSAGEDWQDSTPAQKNNRGIYRMGFPFIAIPASEAVEHGYTPNLVFSEGKPERGDCHPDLKARYSKLKQFTIDELDPSGALGRKLRPPADRLYWGYKGYEEGATKIFAVHDAGWKDTKMSPLDLAGTGFQCRVYCHFGCSSFKHNYPIVRGRGYYNWRRQGNERYCYWTTAPSRNYVNSVWLYHMFTYPKRNDFRPWKALLDYGVARTNSTLRGRGFNFGII